MASVPTTSSVSTGVTVTRRVSSVSSLAAASTASSVSTVTTPALVSAAELSVVVQPVVPLSPTDYPRLLARIR